MLRRFNEASWHGLSDLRVTGEVAQAEDAEITGRDDERLYRPYSFSSTTRAIPVLGWSLGGNVAQSIAVQLQEAGEDIELLAILDAYPSHYLPIKETPDEDEALTALLALGGFDRESIEAGLGDAPLTIAAALELLCGMRQRALVP